MNTTPLTPGQVAEKAWKANEYLCWPHVWTAVASAVIAYHEATKAQVVASDDIPTPRTDAAARKYLGWSEVHADFARTLERELAAALDTLRAVSTELNAAKMRIVELEAEVADRERGGLTWREATE